MKKSIKLGLAGLALAITLTFIQSPKIIYGDAVDLVTSPLHLSSPLYNIFTGNIKTAG